MRSYAAGEIQIFRLVRLPSALPYHLLGVEGRDRARDDRRHRGRVLPQLARGARDPDSELRRDLRVRARVGGDRRREHARDAFYGAVARGRAADDGVASVRRGAGIDSPKVKWRDEEGRTWLGSLAAGMLGLVACGGDDDESAARRAAASARRQGDPPAQVGHAGAVRRLLRRAGAGLLRATRTSTSRSSRAARTSCPSRSCSASRPSSGSTGCQPARGARPGRRLVNIAQVFATRGCARSPGRTRASTTHAR